MPRTPEGRLGALCQEMADCALGRMQSHGVDPGTRTTAGMGVAGFLASWMTGLIETGELASLNINEFDVRVGRLSQPWSRIASNPSFTPITLAVPVHVLPDGIAFDESGPVFRTVS